MSMIIIAGTIDLSEPVYDETFTPRADFEVGKQLGRNEARTTLA